MEEITPREVSPSDRTLALLTHLSGIFSILPPLIVYLVKKNDGGWIRRQTAEALNFQLTMLVLWAIGWVLVLVLIGFLILWVLGVLNIVLCIIAAVKANDGIDYRYPLAIRFVR